MAKPKNKDVHAELNSIYKKLRAKKKKEWDRVLPLDELFSDRWEFAKYLNAKEGASVYHNSYIYGDVKIGKNTWIGPYTLLDGSGGGIKLGDYVSISSGVHVYTHNVVKSMLSGGKIPYEKNKVKIGNNTYIGPYAIISMKGSIGNQCVIGAHSFVNSKIPDNSIAVGIPAKIVGKTIVKNNDVKLIYFKKRKSKK